jgi:hypothetical protein
MNDQQYRKHALERFASFTAELLERTRELGETDSLRELSYALHALSDDADAIYREAPGLVSRLFTTYPDFAPLFPRELLWFLGGDCLHFMPDDEIALYQRLEDMRDEAAQRGEVIDFQVARAKLLKNQQKD